MKSGLTMVLAVAGAFCAGLAMAAPLKLEPASPQPKAGQLKPGLAVSYAYPTEVRNLTDAERALRRSGKKGKPLSGLDYRDTEEGEMTLTSTQALRVVAGISGYVRFDAPGVYNMDFLSNDGLQVSIGGKEVVYLDERTPCDPSPVTQVQVPEAGWYALEAVYFQRLGTACLHMRAGPEGGKVTWMPDSAFAYK